MEKESFEKAKEKILKTNESLFAGENERYYSSRGVPNTNTIVEDPLVTIENTTIPSTNQNTTTTTPEPIKEKEIIIDTPLGQQKITVKNAPEDIKSLEIKGLEDLQKIAKEKYNVDIQKVDDIFSYIENAQKLPEKENELQKYKSQADEYKGFVDNLPPEIANVAIDFYEGKNYKETMKKFSQISEIDFTKDVNKYDAEELIKIYNPEYTDEELTVLEDKEKAALVKNATILYNNDKNFVINRKSSFEQGKISQKEEINRSIEKSLDVFKKNNPNAPEKTINELRKTMQQGLKTKIINEKGVYNDNAADFFALGIIGRDTINVMQTSMQEKFNKEIQARVQEEREFITKNSPDRIESRGTAKKDNTPIDDVTNRTEKLLGNKNGGGFSLRNRMNKQ